MSLVSGATFPITRHLLIPEGAAERLRIQVVLDGFKGQRDTEATVQSSPGDEGLSNPLIIFSWDFKRLHPSNNGKLKIDQPL